MKVAQQMDIVQQLESLREWGQNPLTKKDKFSEPITKSGLRWNYTKDKIEDKDGDTVSMRDTLNDFPLYLFDIN